MFELLACRVSAWAAHPFAVLGLPLVCAAWMAAGGSVDALTLVLSVLALSLTQLVLVAQARGERNVKAMLREMVRALPEADDTVAEDEQ